MMQNIPEDLRSRTKSFALSIIRMFTHLPKTAEAQILGRQVLRSGTSIGANYREAYRARSDAEFVAKLGDCLKEAEETVYWLELLSESNIVQSDMIDYVQQEIDQLIAIFVSSIKKRRSSQKKPPQKSDEG